MSLVATYVSKAEVRAVGQLAHVELRDGQDRLLFYLMLRNSEMLDVRVDELDALGAHVQKLLTDSPFPFDRELKSKQPYWAAPAAAGVGGGARAPRATGPKVAPEGATYLPDGEIVVPPRSKTETPEQKRFRRACRSYRNFQRGTPEETTSD